MRIITKMFPADLRTLNDQQRHDYILKSFILSKNKNEERKLKRDIDVIRENHRFLWQDDDEDDCNNDDENWAKRLARRYYDKLFKEYCIADLTRYKENKIALRWRTEHEVVSGIGQFQCGSRKCNKRDDLRTWEVNFAYQEQGERKNALVKLRLCSDHSAQLNYTSTKREIKRLKRAERYKSKERKNRNGPKHKKVPLETDINVRDKDEHSEQCTSVDEDAVQVQQAENDDVEYNENSLDTFDNVWNQKLETDVEPVTRESEFERYLEDLLL